MKWIEAKVLVTEGNTSVAEELISDIFLNFQLEGVVVEDPDADPEEGWGDDRVEPPEFFSVTGYIPADSKSPSLCAKLESELEKISAQNRIISKIIYSTISEEDWSQTWKEYFWPEKLSRNIVVKPTWREYEALDGEIVLEIDPGMAFGTGTHPTTSLCIGMIEDKMKPGSTVLDVGTGSGILLIAASKLGAGQMTGVDIDPVAVDVAGENLELNSIDKSQYDLVTGDLLDVVKDRYEVVVANILAEIVVILLDDIKSVLADDGLIILSGIIKEKEKMVADKLENKGYTTVEIREKEGWVAIAAKM